MKNIWDKRINGIPLIMLIIISIFLIYVASATGIEILFSNAGRGYTVDCKFNPNFWTNLSA